MAIKLRQKQIDDKIAEDEKAREATAATTRSLQAKRASDFASIAVSEGESKREPVRTQLARGEAAIPRLQAQAAESAKKAADAQTVFDALAGGRSVQEMMASYDVAARAGNLDTKQWTQRPTLLSGLPNMSFGDAILAMKKSDTDAAALAAQIETNEGTKIRLADLDAQIASDKALKDSSDKLAVAESQKADQINAELGIMKEGHAKGTAQQILADYERDASMRFGGGGATPGNMSGLSPGNNLERDIAQAIAGIAVHATGYNNEAFLRQVLDALNQLVASHKLTADQVTAATGEIASLQSCLAANLGH
jgi:hypothetical protein